MIYCIPGMILLQLYDIIPEYHTPGVSCHLKYISSFEDACNGGQATGDPEPFLVTVETWCPPLWPLTMSSAAHHAVLLEPTSGHGSSGRCALAFLCSASLAEKVDFAHSLFDFGLEGDLSLPEVTILLRTVLIACAKVVPPFPFPLQLPLVLLSVLSLMLVVFFIVCDDADGDPDDDVCC